MALLATLQEAGILPPEGTPEANKVIQIVIQFQGLFMKSTDSAVRQFVERRAPCQVCRSSGGHRRGVPQGRVDQ